MITLSVQHLKKRIGKKEIIKDMTFEVNRGEVFGFLGSNGAGKTTTIRMLVGLIRPTSGVVKICGYDIKKDFIKAMRYVGSIVENPELYKFLSGRENLEQFSRMLGPIDHKRINEVIRLVELEHRIDDQVKTYSMGMRQRLGIAQALLGKPRLLILDEPTNGLDPGGIKELRFFIRRLAHEEQISVFVSSHMLSEIQMMCDRVAIISHGSMIRTVSVKELVDTENARIEWQFRPIDKGIELLRDNVPNVEIYDDSVICHMPVSKVEEINKNLVEHGICVNGIRRLETSLESLFLEVTGGDRIE